METKEILNKIGQLQYEISLLELYKETLTGVTIRTDELKALVSKNESLHLVSGSFMSLIDRAVKLIEDDKPYTKEFLIHVWYGREEELKKHVESAENNNER